MVGLVQLDYSTTYNIYGKEGGRFYHDLNEGGDTFYRTGTVESG